jgi:amino acid adenylation domain-containing protein/non-ribosomal peptide synthase protein (TIGR01720 family)
MSNNNIEDIYELSPMQQGMLFHTLDAPHSGVYFRQLSWTIKGLDRLVFKQTWAEIVERHATLRTAFVWERVGKPLQVVRRNVKLPWEELDWRGVPEAEQKERLETLLRRDRERGFQLAKAPLMRLTLIRMGDDVDEFVWSHHHLLLDGWTLATLCKEVFVIYEALSKGLESRLDRPRPYRDYILWLQQQDLKRAETFWRQTLQGFAAPTALSIERASAASDEPPEVIYDEQRVRLDADTTAALQTLARQHRLTLNTVMQGVWALLLGRFSGEDDVVFGAVVSGRPAALEGFETMVGPFINTLPARVRVSPRAKVISWLRALQEQQTEARQYEYSPLAQVQGWSELGRGVPLFETILAFENFPVSASPKGQEMALNVLGFHSSERGNYPLTLMVVPGTELLLVVSYICHRFSPGAVTRLLAHTQMLLASIASNPEQRICDLPSLTNEERQQSLVDFNDTRAEFPHDKCVHQLFEAQAERTPDNVALIFGEQQLTYRDLNRRANQLAHRLRTSGVVPDTIVGILMPRSIEQVVSLLAVWKAGGAYLPLDPAYPRERLRFMLEDAGVSLLLTTRALLEALPAARGVGVVCLDEERGSLGGESAAGVEGGAGAGNLAYVIYTSGSTGQPKGTLIEHRSLVNYLSWCVGAYNVAEYKGAPVHSSIGFDLTVTSLFSPLLCGRCATLLSDDVDGAEGLSAALETGQGFSLVKLTPAHLEVLGHLLSAESVGGQTRALVVGGEALWGNNLSFWREHAPQTRIINEYGPTETVVGCCVYEIAAGDVGDGAVPIGRPIANTQLYLLDRQGQPVPPGVAGELHVGGAGVCRGYLNRPDLSAEKFIPDPFAHAPGSRLYRTGDLARLRADDRLEFLGRIDHQVKVRGFRIELGEIEATLQQHPAVRECVVDARGDAQGVKRLAAYVVAETDAAPSVEELRRYLTERLPDYMIPSAFVLLERLPLTANGKVDRGNLPQVEAGGEARRVGGYVEPRGGVEKTLAAIWGEVLGVEKVGAQDNFFELGGDSILSIQIIARARRVGLNLTSKQVFQAPTIAELADVVASAPSNRTEQEAAQGEAPLTPIQHWFFGQDFAEPNHWNQSTLLEVPPGFDTTLFAKALGHVIEHHDALRLRFVREGREWRQRLAETPATNYFAAVDLSSLPESERRDALENEAGRAQAGLNITGGPTIRATLFHMGSETPSRLLIVIHHLAVDIVSWGILLDDLLAAYEQLSRGEPIRLESKTTSFKRWAERLEQYAQTSEARGELDYWLGSRHKRHASLPVVYREAANMEEFTRDVVATLTEEETQALLQDVPKAYRTVINDVLLTALARAFAAWTGERSPLLVNLEGHGREALFEDVDLSRTVGWFTSVFPILLDLGEAEGIEAELKAIKEQLRSVPRGGIGYGVLRYLCQDGEVREKLRALPEPEVVFNYTGRSGNARRESLLFRPAAESKGASLSPRGKRTCLLEINGGVADGRLQMVFSYSERLQERANVERLATAYVQALRQIITHCQRRESVGFTPSDFMEARLNQDELDKFIAAFNQPKGAQ